MFDRKLGLSKAEFEFPVYFNFFCKQRRVRIVTDRDSRKKIEAAFQETLFGPAWLKEGAGDLDHPGLAQDYPAGTPDNSLPKAREPPPSLPLN